MQLRIRRGLAAAAATLAMAAGLAIFGASDAQAAPCAEGDTNCGVSWCANHQDTCASFRSSAYEGEEAVIAEMHDYELRHGVTCEIVVIDYLPPADVYGQGTWQLIADCR